MRKLVVIVMLCCTALLYGAEFNTTNRYTLSVLPEYTYNRTWGSVAALDVLAELPLHTYVEADARLQLSTANVYTMAASLRPKYPVRVGELFAAVDVYYNLSARAEQWDLTTGLSLGYRMDYVSLEVGWYMRLMDAMGAAKPSLVKEFANLQYRFVVNVQPKTSCWNMYLGAGNKDDFLQERTWNPMVLLGAHYDINEQWRVMVDAQARLTGMLHLNAEFYGAYFRAGFMVKF